MKIQKRIYISIMAVIIGIMLYVLPISAVGGSCIEHGPWIRSCAGWAETRSLSHTFDYQGYTKRCDYTYVLYKTLSTCSYCGYSNYNYGSHSHGYRGHCADCGWSNADYCRLTGQ